MNINVIKKSLIKRKYWDEIKTRIEEIIIIKHVYN